MHVKISVKSYDTASDIPQSNQCFLSNIKSYSIFVSSLTSDDILGVFTSSAGKARVVAIVSIGR